MCGFCGFLRLDGAPADPAPLAAMGQAIWHRGPDDGAVVVQGPLGLANRRLAILDLRPEARLPMVRGPLTLGYNGEFYRFREHRADLQRAGHTFTTHGDSEVLLALYREHGEAMVDRLDGMFAFAIWDSERQVLLLGRDPAGKKPLYYYQDSRVLVFGSEIKSLLLHPEVPRTARRQMLPEVLSLGYAPTPETCFDGIKSLEPGQLLVVRDGHVNPSSRSYGVRLTTVPDLQTSAEEWCDRLIDALRHAVELRLISDVPFGAFLSGGLDSALVVALMAELMDQPVKTFSIGFSGHGSWDETAHAQRVSELFATHHTPFQVGPPDVQALLPELVWHHDQPFGDSSAIPMLVLSRLARQHVTVALGGDASDELFAGYERFRAAKLAAHRGLNNKIAQAMSTAATTLVGRLPQGSSYANRFRRLWETADGLRQPMPRSYFRWVRIATPDTLALLMQPPYDPDPDRCFEAHFEENGGRSWLERILEVNYRTYLLDDLLVKTDRMSMAASLELRSPFLDAGVIEVANAIPATLKLLGKQTKGILKQAARRLLPDDIIFRRKHGFGVPLGEWFRGSLGVFAREILLDRQSTDRGLFARTGIETLFAEHQDGRRDHSHLLWTLLTVEQWYNLFIDPATLTAPTSVSHGNAPLPTRC